MRLRKKNKQTRWSMVQVLGQPSTAATSTWTWMLLLTNLYFFAIPLVFSCLKIRCWGPCQISAPPSLVEDHGRLWRSWSWGPSHRHRRPDDPGAKKKQANIRPPNNTPATKLRGVNLAFPCHRRDTSFFLHSIDTACRKSWTTMFNHWELSLTCWTHLSQRSTPPCFFWNGVLPSQSVSISK